MAFYFKNTKKDIIMKKKMKIIEMITFVDFVKKKSYLIMLEIIVIVLVNIEDQLIVNVILM